MLLSVIIPVYNEEATVEAILSKVRNVELNFNCSREIVLINDGSDDGSEKTILDFIKNNPTMGIVYHRLEQNMGKGYSIRRGLQSCSGDLIVIQDSDLEYDPNDYNLLLDELVKNKSDVVYGNRFNRNNKRRNFIPYLANKSITAVSNILSGQKLNDIETGMKMFRKQVLDKIELIENGFGFEPEVTLKLAKQNVNVHEVNINYKSRSYKEGKKIGVIDGFRTIYCLFKYS